MSMSPNTKTPSHLVSLRFLSLEDVGFFLGTLSAEQQSDASLEEKLRIQLSASATMSEGAKKVMVILEVTYSLDVPENEEQEQIILKHKSQTDFLIENFDEVFVKNENGGYLAHNNVSKSLLGICISTVRGILIEKTANSFLKNFPLPVVAPNDLIKVEGLETVKGE